MTVTVAMNSILIVDVKYFTVMMCQYHFDNSLCSYDGSST